MQKFWNIFKKVLQRVFFYLVILPAFFLGFSILSLAVVETLPIHSKEDFNITTDAEFKTYCQAQYGQNSWREDEKICYIEDGIIYKISAFIVYVFFYTFMAVTYILPLP